MKVSDYIVEYLSKKGIETVFGYPGGMVTHLMDSFSRHEKVASQLCYHEQGAGFSACGYAQATGKIGVAYATSGPGATNLITPICHAFFESIPVLFITGQVNTFESKGELPVRQKGFQETDIISMVQGVTKYAAYVEDAKQIKFYLDSACYHAENGRPGAVLLDIPMDVQRSEIDPFALVEYNHRHTVSYDLPYACDVLIRSLKEVQRPVLLCGNGINSSGMRDGFRAFVNKLSIPTLTSMTAVDVLPHSMSYGFIGAYGHRCANMILSQCDMLISIGSRLDNRQTGADLGAFAPNAQLLRFDIDEGELFNKVKDDEISVLIDLKALIPFLAERISPADIPDYSGWKRQCDYYKNRLDQADQPLFPNQIMMEIGKNIPDDTVITTDVGQNQVWAAQSLEIKPGQRVLFSGGHGAMGVSLPEALGAYFGTGRPVVCMSGDGGLQMNIQELQMVAREKIPVKILVFNNRSLGMIRHFQEMYFASNFAYTVEEGGYLAPDFVTIGEAYGIRSCRIDKVEEAESIRDMLEDDKPLLVEVDVGDTTYVYPKLEYKKPIYDQEPPIDRKLLAELLEYKES